MLYIVCVVYNKVIEDITSLKQFVQITEKYENVSLLILDNSTDQAILGKNQVYRCRSGVNYSSNEGNIGLSKAYNKALNMIEDSDWILWTDDDTEFSEEYLENVHDQTEKDSCNIVSGVVKTKAATILSPTNRNREEVSLVSNRLYDGMYFINSGLCIKRMIYSKIGFYDERLFIDMVDYWLFDELHKKNLDTVYIVEGGIVQDFSGTSKAPLKSQLKRFRIYYRDFSNYCRIEKKNCFYRTKIIVKRFLKIIYTALKG